MPRLLAEAQTKFPNVEVRLLNQMKVNEKGIVCGMFIKKVNILVIKSVTSIVLKNPLDNFGFIACQDNFIIKIFFPQSSLSSWTSV